MLKILELSGMRVKYRLPLAIDTPRMHVLISRIHVVITKIIEVKYITSKVKEKKNK